MTLTITLSERLTDLLEHRAQWLQVSAEQLAMQMLNEALNSASSLPSVNSKSKDLSSLRAIVATIKATSLNANTIEFGEKYDDLEYIDTLLANPPKDTVTAAEWENLWPQVENELQSLDLPSASAKV